MPMILFDGEPDLGPWRVAALADVLDRLGAAAAEPTGRPAVVAVDGRSGGGKTTVAERLAAAAADAVVVHADDLSWNHAFFDWSELLFALLEPVLRGEEVTYRPPAWEPHGRTGVIRIPAGTRIVLVEGVGSARRAHAPILDAVVWVQSDRVESERRGIERDGGHAEAAAFWEEWMAAETPFLATDRPWERADLVVCGTPDLPYDPATELVISAR